MQFLRKFILFRSKMEIVTHGNSYQICGWLWLQLCVKKHLQQIQTMYNLLYPSLLTLGTQKTLPKSWNEKRQSFITIRIVPPPNWKEKGTQGTSSRNPLNHAFVDRTSCLCLAWIIGLWKLFWKLSRRPRVRKAWGHKKERLLPDNK